MVYIAILCGGDGSRLWPVSRREEPKQFLDLMGCGRTLLQLTEERAAGVVPPERIIAITTPRYAGRVREQLPSLPDNNLLVEPAKRNTAPAVLMGIREILERDEDAIIVLLPSDHIVMRQREFSRVIEEGIEFVKRGNRILSLATAPQNPSIAHRYIQAGSPTAVKGIYQAVTFTGKPNLEMAKIFYESGEFLWNTGILIFPAKVMAEAYQRYAPDIWEISGMWHTERALKGPDKQLERIYSSLRSVTVDDAILENLRDTYVCKADIGWSDLGSWNALYEVSPKNTEGNVTQNTMVYSSNCRDTIFSAHDDKLIVASGLENFIVADNGNALLIYPRGEETRLRAAVKSLRTLYGDKFQ